MRQFILKTFVRQSFCQFGHLMCRFVSIFSPLLLLVSCGEEENHYFCAKSFFGAVQFDNEMLKMFLLAAIVSDRRSSPRPILQACRNFIKNRIKTLQKLQALINLFWNCTHHLANYLKNCFTQCIFGTLSREGKFK